MCNLYSITTNQAAIIALFRVVNRYVGNLAPMPGVFPDYKAPIVRNGVDGRELATARWGMPSSSKALTDATKKRAEKLQAKGKSVDFKELLRMEPDGGTTNIRNVKSKHWTRWLGTENRCVVPFNSFSEFNKAEGGDIWFALDESRPLACFAGMWTNWTSVRKIKEGETTNDLYAFLTTAPNVEVGAIHPKAMPVILTTPQDVETWMTAPPNEALKLQRPLPDRIASNRRSWRQGRFGRVGDVTVAPLKSRRRSGSSAGVLMYRNAGSNLEVTSRCLRSSRICRRLLGLNQLAKGSALDIPWRGRNANKIRVTATITV